MTLKERNDLVRYVQFAAVDGYPVRLIERFTDPLKLDQETASLPNFVYVPFFSGGLLLSFPS